MDLPAAWELQLPTPDQLAVLATCWGVEPDELADPGRAWVQAVRDGDAHGPRVVALATRTLAVLPPPGNVSVRWTSRMVGLRGLVRLPARPVPLPAGLRALGPDDEAAVRALHARTSLEDLAAAAPGIRDAELTVGVHDGDRLVGAAAVVPTPAGPSEVSVLIDPSHRRRGLALALEEALIGAAGGGRHRWLQHRTVLADAASQALAARCGFTLVSVEHLVRPVA